MTRRRSKIGTVYLIHFDSKLKHAAHYIGFTTSVSPLRRLKDHRNSCGAVILKVLNQLGIKYHIVRTWKNVNRDFERSLKNKKHPFGICPICNPKLKQFTYRLHRH